MNPRRHEVEWKDGEDRQEPLDEALSTLPLRGICGAMDTVQELGGGDGGDADRLIRMRGHGSLEIEGLPLGSDQDGRVDQRAHGDRGKRFWLRTARRTSDA